MTAILNWLFWLENFKLFKIINILAQSISLYAATKIIIFLTAFQINLVYVLILVPQFDSNGYRVEIYCQK